MGKQIEMENKMQRDYMKTLGLICKDEINIEKKPKKDKLQINLDDDEELEKLMAGTGVHSVITWPNIFKEETSSEDEREIKSENGTVEDVSQSPNTFSSNSESTTDIDEKPELKSESYSESNGETKIKSVIKTNTKPVSVLLRQIKCEADIKPVTEVLSNIKSEADIKPVVNHRDKADQISMDSFPESFQCFLCTAQFDNVAQCVAHLGQHDEANLPELVYLM